LTIILCILERLRHADLMNAVSMVWWCGSIEKGDVKYEFKNMEERHFRIVELDISNVKSASELVDMADLGDDIIRIVLKGTRNIDIADARETFNLLR